MDSALKQRLVGATVIVALGVIFIPMLLERGAEDARLSVRMEIPPKPEIPANDVLDNPPKVEPIKQLVPINQAIAAAKPKLPETKPESVDSGDLESKSSRQTVRTEQQPVKSQNKTTEKVTGSWLVQVGSFNREENARQLQEKLKSSGFDVYLESAKSPVGPIYRVRIGPQKSRADAEKLVGQLAKQGGYRAIILVNE